MNCQDCGKALTPKQVATGLHWCNPKTYRTALAATRAWLRKAKKDGVAETCGGGGGWWAIKGMGKIQGFTALALRLVAGRRLVQVDGGWQLQDAGEAITQQSVLALNDLARQLRDASDKVRRGL